MLRLFLTTIWDASDRTLRDRIFHLLGDAGKTDFVYVNRGTERYMVHCLDRVIGREVFLSGQFDFDKVVAALRLVTAKTGKANLDVLVDVGANIGTVCIPAVARGLAKRAIAIEPDPTNSRLLRINVLLNSLDAQVEVHQCAVGEHVGRTLTLEQSNENWGDHRISVTREDGDFGEASRKRIEVLSTRLDALVQSAEDLNMLIWMDTQGYEGFVLKGATKLLAAKIPLVSEFWPYGMKRAGSYAPFKESLAHYSGFVDLNAAQGDVAALRPIGELDNFFRELDSGKDSYTDVLFV